jgi:DNA transposition AAA+ family ATPase
VGTATEFLVTKEYRRFAEFCDACRRDRYIGLCYGAPGVGKTLSARHYARWDEIGPVVEPRPRARPWPRRPDLATCRSIVYTPGVATSPREIEHALRGLCAGLDYLVDCARHAAAPAGDGAAYPLPAGAYTELILVDEADRLKMPGLEQVRDVYDRSGVGLVLIGMPGLERRLVRYPQLYSRIGFVHHYRALAGEELRFLLAHKWQQLGLTLAPDDFTDAEAVAAIARMTGGNFRLVQRLWSQIERILQINGLRTVTKEVVEAARDQLIIGVP